MRKAITIILGAMLLASPAMVAKTIDSVPSSQTQDKKVKKEKNTKTVTYNVNMHCKSCANKITDRVSFAKGVEDLKVSLDDKTVTISYNPEKTDEETLAKAIEKCGYTADKVKEEEKK